MQQKHRLTIKNKKLKTLLTTTGRKNAKKLFQELLKRVATPTRK
jgi:hypothetical protein